MKNEFIPIYKREAIEHVCAKDAIDSTWLSSSCGKYRDQAIGRMKELSGCKYAVLTSSGTTAMHLVAKSLRYKYPNIKKLIIPDNVYVAAINPFLYDGDYWDFKVMDTDQMTWNMSLDLPNEECAVLIVHNIGNIINVPLLKRKYPKAVFVEDNCEGFLGKYEDKPSGSESLCSAVSFYGNKTISNGEGGCFLTNDKDVFEYAYRLHSQGETDIRFVHDVLGYNYRMTNVSAALLCDELLNVDRILEMKSNIFNKYRSEFGEISQVIQPDTINANWMFGIRVSGGTYSSARNYFLKYGIETRPMFYPLMEHKHLKIKSCCAVARELSRECIILPSFPELSYHEIEHIISTVNKYIVFTRGN